MDFRSSKTWVLVFEMKRPCEGDLIEIAARNKFYYIQYVGVHPEYGDTIAIVPESYSHSVERPLLLFDNPSCYLIFYPVKASLRHKLIRIIGNGPCRFCVPTTLRRPGRIDSGPVVANWFIDEADGTTRVTERLSQLEKEIPLGAGWNHEMLLNRIDKKWHPRMYV
jgi:hypothetical protein